MTPAILIKFPPSPETHSGKKTGKLGRLPIDFPANYRSVKNLQLSPGQALPYPLEEPFHNDRH